MPIILIKKYVKDKEEFDALFESSQLPDEKWYFIEKETKFSEKVTLFSNKFYIENNIDDDEIFTDFVNYLRDIEKNEKTP